MEILHDKIRHNGSEAPLHYETTAGAGLQHF